MSETDEYILNAIKNWVWSGFYSPDEVDSMIDDILEDDADEAMLRAAVALEFEKKAAAETFAGEFGVTYPVVLDSSGEVSSAYGVGRGMPISFLVAPDGVIEKVVFGQLTEEQFAEIEELLQ